MRKMKLISVRKCYFIAKVSLLMILVVSLLGLFEKWRGGKRAASAFSDLEEEYERQILEDEARIIPGLGEGGAAAYLSGVDKLRGEESEKKLAMNVYLSDRISYNRTLKDQRNPACARVVYDAELPSASVILIFHNEPYSVVLRTIWSVINSCRRDQPWFRKANFLDRDGRTMRLGYPGQAATSPLVYLKEIILVDDNSTLPELKGKLSHYVRTRLPPDLIRILRLPDRQGLIQARMRGARTARGDVLVFLDAHCEVLPDWLRPLLQRVRDKRDAVVTPVIDVLNERTFELVAAEAFEVGGFSFTGHFTWIEVTQQEKKRRGSDISPTWSPTMAGGLFAINRAYYWELGAYDEQMSGWGGENLEMSFRIWQCGGTLETIPCSRVGHVFRSFHPYAMPGNSDTHGINTARMAEVWMDDYAELFYLHRPDLRNNPKIGDVTHRKILREKLQCKSFQWYLDNIYKEKFVPIRDTYGYGRFRNPSTGLCIDTLQREGEDAALGVYACHPDLQATQYYVLSLAHELRDEDSCAHVQFNRHAADEEDTALHKVFKAKCHGKQREQKWVYLPATKQIQHSESQLCLDSGLQGGADLLAKPCSGANTQQWVIDYTEDNDFKLTNGDTPSDQELRLARLRGQRRKSRSLLSVGGSQRRRHHKKHHKRSKKSRAKNKFILKLVRTLVNNTDEHLEVDIHCKHNQLYPNNSFVRDLVTILNERNVKVINNGRVFDHNKVTPLDPKQDEDRKLPSKMAPEEAVQQVKRKARARKHKPSAPGNLLPAEYAPSAPEHAPEHARLASKRERTEHASARTTLTPRSHRIIIEDFIQMTPATLVKNMKRRKRTLAPHSPPALPAAAPEEDGNSIMDVIAQNVDPHTDEQVDLLPPSEEQNESTENAPMASESETHSRAEEKLARDKHKDIDTKLKKMKEYKKKTKEMRERDRDLSTVAERKRHKKERDDEKEKEENDNNIEEAWSVGESRFRAQDHDIRRHRAHTEVPTVQSDDDDLSRRHRAHTEAPTVQSDDDELSRRLRAHTETPTVHADDARRERAHSKASTVQFDDDALYRDESMEEQTTPRPASAASPAAPVKVVMQSNLTFNLGHNFFKWRSNYKNSDDEAPSGARATPVKAWLRGHTRGPEDDVIATGHLEKAVPDVAPASEERSSSSESASAD